MSESFRAMGCEVVVSGGDPARVRRLLAVYERTFSRFLPYSELTRVNAADADAVRVSPLFARAVRTALDAARETDGLVDPTLGQAIEAAGYDRDFALLRADVRPARAGARGAWRSVTLEGLVLRRPRGVELDLNGVVKSLAVDDSAAHLGEPGFVSAGGDVAVRGEVDVGLPGGDAVCVRSGGLATSGSILRSGSPVKQIVSMNGRAGDDQKVFVRADLLVDPQRVEATSFQMEYLPSGVVCRGLVTSVGPTSFVGTCRLSDGRPRHVDASWTIDETGTVNGTIRSHA